MKKTNKYLITGCGRSGTGFYAYLLNYNNILCGHETYFKPNTINLNFTAESSWLAVPFLKLLNNDIYVLRTLRNPFKVIKSFYEIGVLNQTWHNSPYQQFIFKHLPQIEKYDEFTRIALYYLEWNRMFDNLSKHLKIQTNIFENIKDNDHISFFNQSLINDKKIINSKLTNKNRSISIPTLKTNISSSLIDELEMYYNLIKNNDR